MADVLQMTIACIFIQYKSTVWYSFMQTKGLIDKHSIANYLG